MVFFYLSMTDLFLKKIGDDNHVKDSLKQL